jgi:hypothetical protein
VTVGELLVGKQPHEPCAGALGHLAVLLEGPPVCSAKLLTAHLPGNLADKHKALVGRESTGEQGDSPQLLTDERETFDVGASVGDLQRAFLAA